MYGEQTSSWTHGIPSFSERFTLTGKRGRARIVRDRRRMRVFAESRYSQSHRPDVTTATDEAEEREREVSEEPEGKAAGDLRRWSRGA